jgi:hypothetical protein
LSGNQGRCREKIFFKNDNRQSLIAYLLNLQTFSISSPRGPYLAVNNYQAAADLTGCPPSTNQQHHGGNVMLKQKDMEDAMVMAHQNFMSNLGESLDILEGELKQAGEMTSICNDEWCNVAESYIDDMHKSIYSISEPRWLSQEDSRKLKDLRKRVRELYRNFAHVKQGRSA